MNEPLAQLERQLELLIEGSLARLLGAELSSSDVAARSAFLIEDGETIRSAWMLGRELPDIDAVIAAAR